MRISTVSRDTLLAAVRRAVVARPQEPDEELARNNMRPLSHNRDLDVFCRVVAEVFDTDATWHWGGASDDWFILEIGATWTECEVIDSVLAALLPRGTVKLILAHERRRRTKKAP